MGSGKWEEETTLNMSLGDGKKQIGIGGRCLFLFILEENPGGGAGEVVHMGQCLPEFGH